jgi:uncharacterized protein with HEPN domain
MKRFNLSEAAKEILGASVSSKHGGQDKPQKLTGDVAYGTKDAGDIGTQVTKTTDAGPDATKGTPTATAPGATPPVGSEPMKKLKGQPGESGSVVQPEGKPGTQKMAKNPGATFQSYGEETEEDGDLVEEEKEEKGHEDAAQDKAMIKAALKKEKMKEDIDAMLAGENLSEEFATKAATIFEAAVIARAEEVIAEAEEELQQQFNEAVEQVKEELAAKVDDYLNYMVEEWVKENQLAIEKGLRGEIVEDFMAGLRNLFVEHYIDIPTDKVDVVEELTTRVEELEASLNEQIKTAVDLSKEVNEHKKFEAIHAVCESLTQTQVEKMKSLAEGIEFTTEEEFAEKLETIKESYFASGVKAADSSALNDEVQIEEEKKSAMPGTQDALIEAYAKTISQTLVK